MFYLIVLYYLQIIINSLYCYYLDLLFKTVYILYNTIIPTRSAITMVVVEFKCRCEDITILRQNNIINKSLCSVMIVNKHFAPINNGTKNILQNNDITI